MADGDLQSVMSDLKEEVTLQRPVVEQTSQVVAEVQPPVTHNEHQPILSTSPLNPHYAYSPIISPLVTPGINLCLSSYYRQISIHRYFL